MDALNRTRFLRTIPFVLAGPLLIAGLSASCQTSEGTPALNPSGNPTSELLAQIDSADGLFDQRAYDEARQRYQAIYLAADSRGYDQEAAEAAAQVSVSLSMLGNAEAGAEWLSRAEKRANESNERAWSRTLLARGVKRWKAGDALTARRTFISLYNYCLLHSLTPRAIQAATLASLSSQGQEQLDWSMRAIQAAQTTGNLKWQAPLWSSHAWLLDQRGRAEEALDAFKKARDLTGRVDISRLGRLQTDWAYGHGLRMAGRLDDARDLLEETNAILHSVYIGKPSPRAAEYLGRVLWEIGEIDATEGRKERARERFIAARDKLIEAGAIDGAPRLVKQLDKRIEALDAPPPERRFRDNPRR
ncbi:MAG: hypothetical protein AAGG01_10965 [Planctomycetota bacterium]